MQVVKYKESLITFVKTEGTIQLAQVSFFYLTSVWVLSCSMQTAASSAGCSASEPTFSWCLALVKIKILILIKAAVEQSVYLSPAASFSIAALRSSAFCCERRKTFLSS